MFRAVASYSGALTTIPAAAQVIVRGSLVLQGFDPNALWGDPSAQLQIWQEHDPYSLAEQLVGIPVFVSAGNGNPGPLDAPGTRFDALEQAVLQSAQAFSANLAGLGGDVTTDLYGAGTHSWPYWQQELHRSFPLLMSAIGAS
jgi:S-formylglutathione hydrolase FrmB